MKKLPIGIENFESIIKDGFYYVDKTGLIVDLLNNWGYVNLITRPRRFGKSLNINMLETFFSPDTDKSVFEGLKISDEKALCDEFMGRYPVISLSLKSVDAGDFGTACKLVSQLVNRTALKIYRSVKDGGSILDEELSLLAGLMDEDMDTASLYGSFAVMSEILEKCYGSKVIILIDEYDVPLSKAYEQGYYDEMLLLVRNIFHQTLKTNNSLKFAVLTGCMRISKESIFTGLNNMRVLSISDPLLDEYFGFTDREVRDMLEYYGAGDRYVTVREWYDGYLFGKVNVYCPWDVVNYCDRLRFDHGAMPENYWINSSSNNAVRKFVECSGNATVRNDIETLVAGGDIEKNVRQELTYQDMYGSVDNIWGVLYTTGYLTQTERTGACTFRLRIPNREILYIFEEQISEWFMETVRADGHLLGDICTALENGDEKAVETCFNTYLSKTISIRDTFVKKSSRENYYHGILVGILGLKDSWGVSSNRETGDGYSDIVIRTGDYDRAVLIEVKYAGDGRLETACAKALSQIEEKRYAEGLLEEGYKEVFAYGIACFRKRCKVSLSRYRV